MKKKKVVEVPEETINLKEVSLFFINFQGEFLSFILDTKINIVNQTDEEVSSQEIPLTVQGYLVDEDDSYYYVGPAPEVIDRVIMKSRVILAQIVRPETATDKFSQVLDDMEDPESENEVN